MSQEIIDNFRGKLWRIICKVDDLKIQVLDEYSKKREAKLKELNNEVNTSSLIELMPVCNSPTEIFEYLKSQYTEKVEYGIKIDLPRTCIGNEAFKRPHKEGDNPLYNVVNAYAHYDDEIGYCQGMCFIAALLLHYLKSE